MVWEPKFGCCFCATPRTATMILGYLEVIIAVFGILGSVKMTFMPQENIHLICHEGKSLYPDFDEGSCYESYQRGIITSVVEQLIRGVIAGLLLVGVNKRNQCLMLPYMILQVIGIVVVSLVTIFLVILLLVFKLWIGTFIALLIGGGLTFLLTYFFLVVRVCYKEVGGQLLAVNNDLEIGAINYNEPSVSDKFMKENFGAPPVYRPIENQPSYPNYYLEKQPLSPPPYSKLENSPTDM